MAEVFVNITGYSNYQVSNFGNVKNINTQRILKGTKGSHGYLSIDLISGKKATTKTIHKMVDNAFI